MDVSALTSRYGQIPEAIQKQVDKVWDHLQKQKDQVVGAKFTSNFGIDRENSLLCGHDVHKGVIVEVRSKYVVSNQDSWLHPNVNQCRALYLNGEKPKDVSYPASEFLGRTNCSAGIYTMPVVNAIGDIKDNAHTIVDIHLLNKANEKRNSWNGKTIDSVYSTSMRDEVLAEADNIAHEIFNAGQRVRADFTNILYRGRGSFYFYNNAYKESGLVLVSPLTGYSVVSGNDHAADYLSSDLIKVNSLDSELQKSFYTKAEWNHGHLVNTFVMSKSFADTTAKYRMKKATFSTTPIHKHMEPAELLDLTPEVKNVPEEVVAQMDDHIKEDKIQVQLTPNVLEKLISINGVNGFQLFNDDFYRENKFVLPRHVIELII
jgi:hypothetical protein